MVALSDQVAAGIVTSAISGEGCLVGRLNVVFAVESLQGPCLSVYRSWQRLLFERPAPHVDNPITASAYVVHSEFPPVGVQRGGSSS